MQGRVTIEFKNLGGKGSNTNINKDGSLNENYQSQTIDDLMSSAKMRLVKRAIRETSGIVSSVISYEISKVYDLTDNVRGQRNRIIARNVISKVGQNIGSAMSGAQIGSIFGPIGTIVGTIIGGTLDLINQGIQAGQGYDKNRIEMDKLNAQLDYTRQNLGASLINGERGVDR